MESVRRKQEKVRFCVCLQCFLSMLSCDICDSHLCDCVVFCRELAHLVTHLCETLKVGKLSCVLVIPPAIAPGYMTFLFLCHSFLLSFVMNKCNTDLCLSRVQYGSAGYVWAGGL